MAVIQEMQKKIEPLMEEAQKGGKPDEIRPKVMKLRKDHEGKLEALLTDAQKKQWKEMLGKPVDLSVLFDCVVPVAQRLSPQTISGRSGKSTNVVVEAATSITPERPDRERKGSRAESDCWCRCAGVRRSRVRTSCRPGHPRGDAQRSGAEQLQGSFVVFRDKVQEDLKLTDEQKEKLEQHLQELLPDLMQFFQKIDGLKPEEREKELKAYRPKAQEKLAAFLKETLKDDQRKRLRQLELQREGAFALWHGDVEIGKDLKITDEQRKQFMAVVQDMQKKIEPLIKEAQSGGKPRRLGRR